MRLRDFCRFREISHLIPRSKRCAAPPNPPGWRVISRFPSLRHTFSRIKGARGPPADPGRYQQVFVLSTYVFPDNGRGRSPPGRGFTSRASSYRHTVSRLKGAGAPSGRSVSIRFSPWRPMFFRLTGARAPAPARGVICRFSS